MSFLSEAAVDRTEKDWDADLASMRLGLDNIERDLVGRAEELVDEVTAHIWDALRQGERNDGLFLVARVRSGRFGCRVFWARNKALPPRGSNQVRFTDEVSLDRKVYTRRSTFSQCTEDLRGALLAYEDRAVIIRKAILSFRNVRKVVDAFPTADTLYDIERSRSLRLPKEGLV